MPLQKNQVLTLTIERLSNDGSGVAHSPNFQKHPSRAVASRKTHRLFQERFPEPLALHGGFHRNLQKFRLVNDVHHSGNACRPAVNR